MSNDETAVPRLVAIDRRQLILRTMDVEKLVEPEHCVRSIWELVGRLDLRLYYAQIAAVEGSAGREHTDPQLLITFRRKIECSKRTNRLHRPCTSACMFNFCRSTRLRRESWRAQLQARFTARQRPI